MALPSNAGSSGSVFEMYQDSSEVADAQINYYPVVDASAEDSLTTTAGPAAMDYDSREINATESDFGAFEPRQPFQPVLLVPPMDAPMDDVPRPDQYAGRLENGRGTNRLGTLIGTFDQTVRRWLALADAPPLVDGDELYFLSIRRGLMNPRQSNEDLIRGFLESRETWRDINRALSFSHEVYTAFRFIAQQVGIEHGRRSLDHLSGDELRKMHLILVVLTPMLMTWERAVVRPAQT